MWIFERNAVNQLINGLIKPTDKVSVNCYNRMRILLTKNLKRIDLRFIKDKVEKLVTHDKFDQKDLAELNIMYVKYKNK